MLFLSLKVKADPVQAALAEPEEAADCEQCLQKETQRQEPESRLHMLGLLGGVKFCNAKRKPEECRVEGCGNGWVQWCSCLMFGSCC